MEGGNGVLGNLHEESRVWVRIRQPDAGTKFQG
jgi:hypothetical protein